MGRALAPCGTIAAISRHRRRKEDLCDKCKQANRDAKNEHMAKKQAEKVSDEMANRKSQPRFLDPLDETWDSLEIVRAVLRSGTAPPSTVAKLTERRDELVDRIKELQGNVGGEISVIDELTNKRRARLAKATG